MQYQFDIYLVVHLIRQLNVCFNSHIAFLMILSNTQMCINTMCVGSVPQL